MAFRYDAALANEIELRWQRRWAADGTFDTPGVSPDRSKFYVLDMFPYPSGTGLHVGHPLGYIATDVYARYLRMTGHHVMHTFGYDAFGLPAEQYAIDTGQHPRVTIRANIDTMRRQLRRLGLGHDPRREIATTDPGYYRWTQWMFLQIFNSWYDEAAARARPIGELTEAYAAGERPTPDGRPWAALTEAERRQVIDGHRLAYVAQEPVNWCPGLGTVLANEEVTAGGRSDVGNYPVYRRPMRQWMLRITAYAQRLIDDLDLLDWPDSMKQVQRNWIGAGDGAYIRFAVAGAEETSVEVFTTRPDTLRAATYVVLAPEHPQVELLVTEPHRAAVEAYREAAGQRGDRQRAAGARDKTGVFTGGHVINPADGEPIPVWVADYVLMGYGTGAIMAVPAEDERDLEFARRFGLAVRPVAGPPAAGAAVTPGRSYRLRDWLFSRQRYWGEPFPIVYDEHGLPVALPAEALPVRLPEVTDFRPEPQVDEDSDPVPPLARARDWAAVELDLGDGPKIYRRELNTMPQWAGSCWYYLRYLDPDNDEAFVDPEIERYWMNVDLYIGGPEHGVLHLLYARFWHKVLYDLGHVSTAEPFQRLFNQGSILADAYLDDRGMYVPATEVEAQPDGSRTYNGKPVTRRAGRMGKSKKNGVSPDEMYQRYGADTLRLYEMAMGPLDVDRPWRTDDVVGVHRFLQRLWRSMVDEASGESRVADLPLDEDTLRRLHRTITVVREDFGGLRFNTAIARLMELTGHAASIAAREGALPRALAEPLVLLVAPLAPHVAEELWSRLGNAGTVTYAPFPEPDPALAAERTVELPIQIDGRTRFTVEVPADAGREELERLLTGHADFARYTAGVTVKRLVIVPGRIANVVTA